MSRLDRGYLTARNHSSWRAAFLEAGKLLNAAPASIKNLRDEFDPIHGNGRTGWKGRPMRSSRLRIMGELCDVSDAALLAMVDRILAHDAEAVQEVVLPLARPTERIHNVAERLRTGRLAEEYFLDHSMHVAGVSPESLLDHRALARGYDFGVRDRESVAIEVKGIKQSRGGVVFTDREWSEARIRKGNYWLVIVGNLETKPKARLLRDPATTLIAKCHYQAALAASWRATVAVA